LKIGQYLTKLRRTKIVIFGPPCSRLNAVR